MFKKIIAIASIFILSNCAFAEQIKGGVSFDYHKSFVNLNYSLNLKGDNILSVDEIKLKNKNTVNNYKFSNFVTAPDKYEISFSTGQVKGKTEDLEKLKNLALNNPNNKDFLFAYAIQLKNDKKFDEALIVSDKILSLNSENALSHFLKGDILRCMGNYKEAAEEYIYTAQLNPYCADAYFNIAKILELLNDRELALDYYRMAYQINPEDSEIKDIILDNYIDL